MRRPHVLHVRARHFRKAAEVPPRGHLMGTYDQRLAELLAISTSVVVYRDEDFYPTPCRFCPLRTETSVRVYGPQDVRRDVHSPVVLEVCCHQCAVSSLGPVSIALSQRADVNRDLHLEVCP